MGREKKCHAPFAPYVVEEFEDLLAMARVEVPRGLVGEKQTRAGDETARDRGPLHLTAGKLVGMRLAAFGEINAIEELARAKVGVLLSIQKPRQFDVLADRQMRQQVEKLEHHADFAAAIERQFALGESSDVASADPDRPGGRTVDSRDEVEERRLAAPRWADDGEELAGGDREVDRVEGDDRPHSRIDLRDPLADDRGRRRRRRARIRRRHAPEDIGYLSRVWSPLQRAWRQRALVLALARRELLARYRGGVLGFLWSLLNPLLLLLVYATVFRLVFTPRSDVRPYALFLFAGVLCWGFVSSALLDAAETFRANGPLLRKTTVAPEVFPAVATGARFAHLVLALPVLAGAIALAATTGSVRVDSTVLQFPLVLVLLATMVLGLGLVISSLSVHFGDVRDLLANLLTLTFFLTPILYPIEAAPGRLRWLLWLNPFTPFFVGIHESAFFFRPVPATAWAGMVVWTLIALAAGAAVFERLRDSIAEEA